MNPSGIEWRQTAQATHGMLRATTKEDSGGFAKRRRVGTHGNNTSQRLGCYYDEWRRAKTWHGTWPSLARRTSARVPPDGHSRANTTHHHHHYHHPHAHLHHHHHHHHDHHHHHHHHHHHGKGRIVGVKRAQGVATEPRQLTNGIVYCDCMEEERRPKSQLIVLRTVRGKCDPQRSSQLRIVQLLWATILPL